MDDSRGVALVTGASSGIGLEFARLLAQRGSNVLLVARSSERLEEIARELATSQSVETYVFTADLAQPEARERLLQFTRQRDLPVHLLVNNAGFGLLGKFHEIDWGDQAELLRLNVEALVQLTHMFLPDMLERGTGGVINIGSMAGFTPGPLQSTYYASKAFVISFTEGLARELSGSGVTVTAVCPGPVPSGFQKRAGFSESRRRIAAVSASNVARIGLDGWARGRRVVIPGVVNKIIAVLLKFAPRRATADSVYRIQVERMSGRK